jgi:hypothetical protein
MAGAARAKGLGPDFVDDGQQDVEVTGTLPMSMESGLWHSFRDGRCGMSNGVVMQLRPAGHFRPGPGWRGAGAGQANGPPGG